MSYEDNKLARVGLSTVTSWSNQLRYPNTKSDLRSYLSSKCNLSFFRIYKCPLVSLGNFTSSEHRSFLATGKVPLLLVSWFKTCKNSSCILQDNPSPFNTNRSLFCTSSSVSNTQTFKIVFSVMVVSKLL